MPRSLAALVLICVGLLWAAPAAGQIDEVTITIDGMT
jgi:hypothetical protein